MTTAEDRQYFDEKFAQFQKIISDQIAPIEKSIDEIKGDIKSFEGFERDVIEKQARYEERMNNICLSIESIKTELRENTQALWRHVRNNLPEEIKKNTDEKISAAIDKRDLKNLVAAVGGLAGLVALIKSFF